MWTSEKQLSTKTSDVVASEKQLLTITSDVVTTEKQVSTKTSVLFAPGFFIYGLSPTKYVMSNIGPAIFEVKRFKNMSHW